MTREEAIQGALIERAESMAFDQTKVAYPNKKFDPPSDGSAYVEVAHFPNRSDNFMLSGRAEYMFGFLQLLVRCPRNQGGAPATKIAGELALHFPANLSLWKDGVRVRISKKPDVMSASPTESSWNVPVTVYYEAFA